MLIKHTQAMLDLASCFRESVSDSLDEEVMLSRLESALLQPNSLNHIINYPEVSSRDFLQKLASQLNITWLEELPETVTLQELSQHLAPQYAFECGALVTDAKLQVIDESTENDSNQPVLTELTISIWNPLDLNNRNSIKKAVGCHIHWVMQDKSLIYETLQEVYGIGAQTFQSLLETERFSLDDSGASGQDDEANIIDEQDEEASVIKFVNQIIREGLDRRATDIHLEPMSKQLRIRYRIDGQLTLAPVPKQIHALQDSVIARIKIMAKLDIAEKRLPQDGRIHLQLEGQSIDVRVASIPSIEGESLSLRLLNQQRFSLDLLNLEPQELAIVKGMLELPHGIILVTGPTGSGKSTSLYAFLSEINDEHKRIVTIEDPVENKLDGVMQIAVKHEIGLDFARGLRSILRADPNVVMIGEIRDLETAQIAMRASLTGHLVFSTLHTNDALSGIGRLVDMGIEPFLVAASVRGFLAQRLVRRLCGQCKKSYVATAKELKLMDCEEQGVELYRAVGCEHCRQTGYLGRLSIYEVCAINDEIESLIGKRASSQEIEAVARQNNFRSLREYGWEKVKQGETSIEEIISLT